MIRTDGPWFKDETGRTLMLRGVNLGGSSKVPAGMYGATHNLDGFFEHRDVTFVGRPFPLEEADEHFARLRAWGVSILRFLITWEAIEHAGPGQYDQPYLDYLRDVVKKAGEYGLLVFIDPHQDMWSRFTGGDGAPGWTLEAAGMDMNHFHETGAAIVHATHGDPLPRMIWPSNSSKLAAATMFTLFFAGNQYAPRTRVDGEPIQEYLQRHYIAAIQQAAERLHDLPHVIGYDTLNEPICGYIGWRNLNKREHFLRMGPSPTPYQSMLLGAGIPQLVDLLERRIAGTFKIGSQMINTGALRAWLPGRECIWRENGVWDLDSAGRPHLLRPDHFASLDGRPVSFANDFYRPFANRFARSIRQIHPQALIFLEAETMFNPPRWGEDDASQIVHAPHWYDAYVLFFKSFSPWLGVDVRGGGRLVIGKRAIRRAFAGQIADLQRQAREFLGNPPTLIGEFGIAFDLNRKQAYRTGDFSQQIQALERNMRAMDDTLANFTLWNYTADNTNERGDLWNDEDFSIFSRDQQTHPEDINSGGRALQAFIRPYPLKTAGEPLGLEFDPSSGQFTYIFRSDPSISAPTELYVPRFQYPDGCRVQVTSGSYTLDLEGQRLFYQADPAYSLHTIRLERAG